MTRQIKPTRWKELAAEPEFRTLLRSRRRFVVPATVFFIAYYLALPISAGFFPAAMSRPVVGPLTLAYCFALSQFAMAWILLALYMRRARAFDVQAARMRRRETHELIDLPQ
ncbi:MAG: DUF485 domain-containing protein [Candidatus Eremiobacteraeota bacterium]|nr:DUF485 domain-containing protein [Candidatus Eremiobacteraeota bacterium]